MMQLCLRDDKQFYDFHDFSNLVICVVALFRRILTILSAGVFNCGRSAAGWCDVQVYQLTVVQLTVVAQDRGPDAMPTDAAVVVRIIDVNDNAPAIIVNTLASRGGGGGGGGAVAEVPENLPAGTFVAHVTVADADSGQFGRVDCNLTDHAFALLRRPDSTEFQVSFLIQLRAIT